MAVTECTNLSTVLSQCRRIATDVELLVSVVHHHLLRAELLTCLLLQQFLLFRNHQYLRLQWACEWHAQWQNILFSMNPASTCPTMMSAYVLDATVVNAIWDPSLLSGIVDKHLVQWFGVPLDTKCKVVSYVLRVMWTAIATLKKRF